MDYQYFTRKNLEDLGWSVRQVGTSRHSHTSKDAVGFAAFHGDEQVTKAYPTEQGAWCFIAAGERHKLLPEQKEPRRDTRSAEHVTAFLRAGEALVAEWEPSFPWETPYYDDGPLVTFAFQLKRHVEARLRAEEDHWRGRQEPNWTTTARLREVRRQLETVIALLSLVDPVAGDYVDMEGLG